MRVLGPAFSAEERVQFVAAARARLNTPWGHHGRRTGRLDCVGLVWVALCAVRDVPTAPTDYGRLPHERTLRRRLIEWFGPPVPREPVPGDVVTWRLSGEEHHVGVVGDHPERGVSLIHSHSLAAGLGGGRVIEHGIDARERACIVEVFAP